MSKHTAFVQAAIRQAAARRRREGHPLRGIVHHSDAGSQGEFNRSSQHPDHGGGYGTAAGLDDEGHGPGGDAVAGTASCVAA